MKKTSVGSILGQVIALVLILGMAYGLEVLLEFLRVRNAMTFDLHYIIMGTYLLSTFLVSACTFLLFWSGINHSSWRMGIGIIFFIIGSLILLAPILYYTPFLPRVIQNFPRPLFPQSIFYFTGGMVAAVGLLMIVLPGQKFREL